MPVGPTADRVLRVKSNSGKRHLQVDYSADDVVFHVPPAALFVNAAGSLVCKDIDDVTVTYTLTEGNTVSISPKTVVKAGSTANVIALWE